MPQRRRLAGCGSALRAGGGDRGHVGCSNELMGALPELRIVAVHGVGLDKIDLPFATGRDVRITTTPGVLTDDVADLARRPADLAAARDPAW